MPALLGGCNRNPVAILEVAAKVDGVPISRQAVPAAAGQSGTAEYASALNGLVSEQLLANAALADHLDNNPKVAAVLESGRRQTLARAYLEQQASLEPALTEADLRKFYDAHPELFAARKIYRVQELAVEVSVKRSGEIAKSLSPLRTLGDRANWLQRNGIPHRMNVVVKPAEDWPSDLLKQLAGLKEGSAFDLQNPKGFSVLQLTGVEEQPLSFEQAKERISRFLANERGVELLKRVRDRLKAKAKIEYPPGASPPTP